MEWFITNLSLVESEEIYLKIIQEISKKQVKWIILREKNLNDDEYKKLYFKIKNIINENCKLIINSNITVYKEVKAEYLHLTFKDFLEYKIQKDEKIGVSIHSIEEGIEASKRGAEYILASNIYETNCKKGKAGMGLNFVKELKNKVECKVIALGGIGDNNYMDVINAGADDCAVMSYYIEKYIKSS